MVVSRSATAFPPDCGVTTSVVSRAIGAHHDARGRHTRHRGHCSPPALHTSARAALLAGDPAHKLLIFYQGIFDYLLKTTEPTQVIERVRAGLAAREQLLRQRTLPRCRRGHRPGTSRRSGAWRGWPGRHTQPAALRQTKSPTALSQLADKAGASRGCHKLIWHGRSRIVDDQGRDHAHTT